MLHITFQAESDYIDIEDKCAEYRDIWDTYGAQIIYAIEKRSGLKFKETTICAVVFGIGNTISQSHPMCLKGDCSIEEKQALLMHELAHRVIYRQRVLEDKAANTDSELLHFHMNLFLFDAWKDVFGEDFARRSVEREKQYASKYKSAWERFKALHEDDRQLTLNTILPHRYA